MPPELRLHSQTHVVDMHNVVLVHVEAADGGPLALIKDGIHQDGTNQSVYEFHTGERYIREGTSNALFRGAPHQVALLLKQRATAPPAADPGDSLTFEAAPSELAGAARELLRRQEMSTLCGVSPPLIS